MERQPREAQHMIKSIVLLCMPYGRLCSSFHVVFQDTDLRVPSSARAAVSITVYTSKLVSG